MQANSEVRVVSHVTLDMNETDMLLTALTDKTVSKSATRIVQEFTETLSEAQQKGYELLNKLEGGMVFPESASEPA